MSRSHKKHPSCHIVCYFSNKEDKTIANRLMRRKNKQIIHNNMSIAKDYYLDDYDITDDGSFFPLDYTEEYPIEQLSNADFKLLREVRDVYDFDSDGLPRAYSVTEPIRDFSVPYSWRDISVPLTTISEAKKNKNWETLKIYLAK